MTRLSDPLALRRASPLANQQSHADGTLSDARHRWLTMRARGGFALTLTCAAHVQTGGQAFQGQLGIWSDAHVPGLARHACAIRAAGSVSAVRLHHGGSRSDPALSGEVRRAPWDDGEAGATALTTAEVDPLCDAAVAAARAVADPDFAARPLPVSAETLARAGLSAAFVGYMGNWKGFLAT